MKELRPGKGTWFPGTMYIVSELGLELSSPTSICYSFLYTITMYICSKE